MPAFTSGDAIALVMVGLSVSAFAVREWRTAITDRTQQATDGAMQHNIIAGVSAKLDDVVDQLRDLESKRQKHEVECAKIQERTAASQQRTAEILGEHGRSIGQLQGQMRHVATGAASKIIEIGPDVKAGR